MPLLRNKSPSLFFERYIFLKFLIGVFLPCLVRCNYSLFFHDAVSGLICLPNSLLMDKILMLVMSSTMQGLFQVTAVDTALVNLLFLLFRSFLQWISFSPNQIILSIFADFKNFRKFHFYLVNWNVISFVNTISVFTFQLKYGHRYNPETCCLLNKAT